MYLHLGREDKPAVLRKHDDFAIDVEKGRVGGNKGPPGLSHKSKHRQAKVSFTIIMVDDLLIYNIGCEVWTGR